jgi:hypothetical protein
MPFWALFQALNFRKLTVKLSRNLSEFELIAVRVKEFEVNDLNHF